ncbi:MULTISPECIES: hypothetical protein [Streptomyces]|uniref:hypothetical protein n=1 Tax=Streptomyces TaxID=1883 RepID=UPI002248FA4E|nr:hypothetical protein [Streptomyces sp. JHD 1]MCX2970651.1 hypothetical protein [Streptomyces sp. JHD 1]
MRRSAFTVQECELWDSGWLVLPVGEHRRSHALARVLPGAPGTFAAPRAAGGPVTVREVEARAEKSAGRDADHPVLTVCAPDTADAGTADGTPAPAGAGGDVRCVVRPEPPLARPRSFAVLDADGRPLGRIGTGRSRWTGRVRWRIEPVTGGAVVGHRGTLAGWLAFAALLPLWFLFAGVSLLAALVTLGHVTELVVWSAPRRVVWRRAAGSRGVLGFRHGRGEYVWDEDGLDVRLALAQAALHTVDRLRG